MSRPRVLVTGGCGFVGSSLVRKLVADGDSDVLVLDDLSLGRPENLGPALSEVTLAEVDLRERDAVVEAVTGLAPQTVIHLAAIHFIPACDADPKRCIDVNVGGTQSLLDGCEAAGVGAVVIASTAAVYAPGGAAHSDDAELGPIDIYGMSKLWAEQLLALFHRRTGIPGGVARLFNVFGPGETNPHLIPAVIRQAESSAELRLGNLATRRDYVFVEDVAQGLIDLASGVRDRVGAGEDPLTCNLGREQAVDGFELVQAVGELMQRELRVVGDPARMRTSDRPLLLSDCSRARSLLGWSARTSLHDGLGAAIARPTAAGVRVD
jgi:UDP-glucose 4-epimerase